MTSIDRNIQEDSLLVIDCFLSSTPQLIVESFNKIFPNFASLISSSKIGKNTLDVNLSSKLTGIKWRVKVLNRLRAILNIITDTKTNTCVILSRYFTQNVWNVCSTIADLNRRILHNGDEGNCFPIYNTSYMGTCPIDVFGKNPACSEAFFDEVTVKSVSSLIVLLHEIWSEAAPESKHKNVDNGK